MDFPDYRRIGSVLKPHSVRGEFLVYLESDFPDWVCRQKKLYAAVDGKLQVWNVTNARIHQESILMKVQEVPDRTAVERLRGTSLWVLEADARAIATDPDFFYNSDLFGLTVIAEEQNVGQVRDVIEMPGHNLLEVEMPNGKRFLLPFVDALIKQIDLENKTLHAIIPAGLIDLNAKNP